MRLSYDVETDSLYIHLSERPGADRIPPVRRHEADAPGRQAQPVDGELIDPRAGLVDSGGIDRQHAVDIAGEPGVAQDRKSVV